MNDRVLFNEADREAQEFANIVLRRFKYACHDSLSEEVIRECEFQIVDDVVRRMIHLYITGIMREEILQETSKDVTLKVISPEYPATTWNAIKHYINLTIGSKFKVRMAVVTKRETTKVTFTRTAAYPRLKLAIPKQCGDYVLKERIHIEQIL